MADVDDHNIHFILIDKDPEKDAKNHICVKSEPSDQPVDWKPQDKCYFCVDGKLLKVNESGELVVETGPVQPETELNKHVSDLTSFPSDVNVNFRSFRSSSLTIRVPVLIRFKKTRETTKVSNCSRSSCLPNSARRIWKLFWRQSQLIPTWRPWNRWRPHNLRHSNDFNLRWIRFSIQVSIELRLRDRMKFKVDVFTTSFFHYWSY